MSDAIVSTLVLLLKFVALIFDIITFIPYFVIQRPDQVRKKSGRVKARPVSGKPSDPWRSVDVPSSGLTSSYFPECKTLDDLFSRASNIYPTHPCLGTREVIREDEEVQPNGKVFKKDCSIIMLNKELQAPMVQEKRTFRVYKREEFELVLGSYQWETYTEVDTRINNFGSGLSALGLKPRSRLVIFSETRAEWMISAQTAFRYNFPVVTMYATLGIDALIHGINETDVTIALTSFDLLFKFQEVLLETPKVTHVVAMGCTKLQIVNAKLKVPDGVAVLSMQGVEALGADPAKKTSPEKPQLDDTAVIMYTSGSTGVPKGVIISHRNFMCGTSGQIQRIPGLGYQDTYVGYLPLAHVLELCAEVSCLALGTRIGYSSPTTLTDKSTRIKRGCPGDVTVLQPTLVAAVPVIMDRIYKNVWEKVNSSSLIQQTLFKFAYDYKHKHLLAGFDTPLCNNLVFKNVADLLGGRVRLMLSGGAPLSGTTQRFMNICFCCPIGQGYGLTETCGAGTVVEFSDLTIERVGAPVVCSEIRLRNWLEGNYTTENKPFPQGEVLIGGNNVAMGYFNNSEKTAEDFITLDGLRYFCTGDIGQFEEDGCLRIIDRKKDLVKLQHGEYISLAQVETVLKMCPLVEQICVVANSSESTVVALIVPNEARLESLAKGLGVQNVEFQDLCKNNLVVESVLKQLTSHGLKSKLQRTEIPSNISLLHEPWMPESGLVTDAFKLKRKAIEDTFTSEISAMYKN